MNGQNRLGQIAPQRVVILRALQLGDLLCAVPAFRALRAALPNAEITLIGLPWARSFVERFYSYLDDFIEFPGFPGFPERQPDIARLPKFLSELQWLEADLAIQMQGSGYLSNSLVALFGARQTAGFFLPGQFCPDPDLFLPYPSNVSEVLRHLNLMDFLGAPLQGEELEFPLTLKDWDEYHDLASGLDLQPGSFVCLHAGARAVSRRWPAAKFAALGDLLCESGYQVVLTGSAEEAPVVQAVAAAMRHPVLNLAGKTSLGAVGALLSQARLLICNDTGVSHLADALNVPSLVLFSDSEPERWAPANQELHRVITRAGAASPEEVLAVAGRQLQAERAYAD